MRGPQAKTQRQTTGAGISRNIFPFKERTWDQGGWDSKKGGWKEGGWKGGANWKWHKAKKNKAGK